jgi:hypothetical protein
MICSHRHAHAPRIPQCGSLTVAVKKTRTNSQYNIEKKETQ